MKLSWIFLKSVALAVLLGLGLISSNARAGGLFDPNAETALLGDLSGATSININTGATPPTMVIVGGSSAGTLQGAVRTTTAGTAVAVFCFDSINLNAGTVTITGARPISLLSKSDATIGVDINLNGGAGVAGQAAATQTGGTGIAGGYNGGNCRADGNGPGKGLKGATDYRGGGAAGYGGAGGTGYDSAGRGGIVNGDIYLSDLQGGSGGAGGNRISGTGATYNSSGGAGGGALEIVALGTLTIPSGVTISANGGTGGVFSGLAADYIATGGGGSGGAIRLSAVNLALGGALQVNGGKGGDSTVSSSGNAGARTGGGGGGGRITIYYTGQMTGTGTLSVAPGLRGYCGSNYKSGETGYVGATLIVKGPALQVSPDTRFNPDNFAAVGTIPAGQTVVLNTDSGLVTANSVEAGHGIHALTAAGSIVAVFAFPDGTQFSATTIAGTHPAVILGKGALTVVGALSANGADGANLAPGLGFAAGGDGSDASIRMWPPSGRGLGRGLGVNGSSNAGSGAGFGGAGGFAGGGTILGGAAYGSPTMLDDLRAGSGGGGSDQNGGGAGGGTVEIIAKGSLTVETAGSIAANGGQGASGPNQGSGGGSGGGILLSGDTTTIRGAVTVNGGGSTAVVGKKPGGGGGGGRIAIFSSGTLTVDGAAVITAYGGTSTGGDNSGAAGSSGTVSMAPTVTASPNPLNIRTTPNAAPATASITVSNGGTVPLNVSSIILTDAGAGGVFSINSVKTQSGTLLSPPYAATLAPGGYATIEVAFNRSSPISTTGQITISSNDPVNPSFAVTLSGKSVVADWFVTPDGLPGGANPGLFRDNPTTTIQGAVAASANGSIIYMMKGLYDLTVPTPTTGPLTTQQSLEIFGGFDGSENQGGKKGLPSDRVATYLADNPTTLTGANITRAVNITAGGASQSLLFDGLIFYNCNSAGSAQTGGAWNIAGVSQVTVTNCIFTSNTGTGAGGAINMGTTAGFVTSGCQFINNYCLANGGAIYMNGSYNGPATFQNCVFTSNSCLSAGGGVCINVNIVATITGCAFTSNTTRDSTNYGGGALYGPGAGGTMNISNSNFIANYTARLGGVLRVESAGTVTMNGCVCDSNRAAGSGGVLLFNASVSFSASNCVFTNNEALTLISGYGRGGVLWNNNAGASASFSNCLFANNKAWENYGGVFYSGVAGPLRMVNCTFVNNRVMGAGASDGVYIKGGAAATNLFVNCLFYGHRVAIDSDATGGVHGYAYNCALDSAIANAMLKIQAVNCVTGDVALANPAANDYHLKDYSIAIGAGALLAGGLAAPATDLDGLPRPMPALTNPDAGAYESAKETPDTPPPSTIPIVYVTATGAGVMDGSSWAFATTFPTALSIVQPGGRIFMKGGAGEIHLMPTSYTLGKSMSIYGGFAGLLGEDDPSKRLPDYRTNYPTTISGQNLYRPLYFVYAGAVTLDALTLTQGYSNTGSGGGALCVEQCGPLTLRDCTISNSISDNASGGARIAWGTFTITRCLFTGNRTTAGRGGGLYVGAATGLIEDSVFTNNEAHSTYSTTVDKSPGGGISANMITGGALTIRNSRITSNTSHDNGGGAGLQVQDNSMNANVILDNCEISGNVVSDGGKNTDQYGGGLYAQETVNLTITSCSIHHNTNTGFGVNNGRGGGMNLSDSVKAVFLNTAITDNRAANDNTGDPYGGGCILQGTTSATMTGCQILRNSSFNIGNNGASSEAFGGGISMMDSARLTMFNCQVNNNSSTTSLGSNSGGKNGSGGGIYTKTSAILQMTSCTVIGNVAFGEGAGAYGVGGGINMQGSAQTTLINCVLALNTSEYGGAAVRAFDSASPTMLLKMIHCTVTSNAMSVTTGNFADGVMIVNNLPTVRHYFINCLFDGEARSAILAADIAVTTGGLAYNCVFGNNGLNNVGLVPGNIIGCQQAVNAGLVDFTGGNYDLLASSPAIDWGLTQIAADAALGAGFVTIPALDVAGRTRVGAPDTGAYELAAPNLYWTPNPFHFGIVDAGTSVTSTITLANAGNVPYAFDAAKWTAPAPYSVAAPFAGLLAPGASVPMILRFAPAAPGDYAGALGYADGAIPLPGATLRGATPPLVISITRLDGNPTSSGAVQWLVTFSQPVVNADSTDFDVATTGSFTGAPAVQSVIPAGATLLVTVNTGAGEGQIQLILKAGSDIAEAAYLSPLVNKPFAGEIYDLDNVPPAIVSIIPRNAGVVSPTSASSVIYDVTFSEPVSGVTAANFAVVAIDGFASGSIANVSNAGGATTATVWQVTVGNLTSSYATGGYLRLDLADPAGIADKLGNPVGATALGGSIWVDRSAPAMNPLVNAEPTSGAAVGSVLVTTVTFSETVTGVTADKLAITTDGVTILSPTGLVSISGAQYVFMLDDVYGSGPVVLNITLYGATGTTIMDAAGNPFSTARWSIIKDVSVVQTTLASPQVADGALTSLTQVTFNVHFSAAMTGFDPAQPGDLLLANCAYVASSLTGSGADYSFAIAPLAQGAATVRVPAGVCQTPTPPIRNNGISNLYNLIFDQVPPFFTNLASSSPRVQVGTTVTLTFTASEVLMANPLVTVNGNTAAMKSKAGNGYTYSCFVSAADAEGSATISMTGTDLAGNSSTTLAQTALYVDKTAPTATIQPVAPDEGPLVTVVFSEDVTGVDASDFVLAFNGTPITGIAGFTAVSPSVYTFTVPNSAPGAYALTLHAAGSGIQDMAGIAMVSDASQNWIVAAMASIIELWTRY